MRRLLSAALALVLLCGCFNVKDELTLNADGSGTVKIETRSTVPPEMMSGMLMSRSGGDAFYPPLDEPQARKFFPGKDFTVSVKQDPAGPDETVTVIEVAFKDINALLASPYGRAHQLSLAIEKNTLVLKAVAGVEGVALLSEMKGGEGMDFDVMPGFADLQKKKNEMRSEFRVTLPNAVASANGTRDGKSATWLVERAKCKDTAEFAQKVGTVAEARCPDDALKFTPITPLRLGLAPFQELTEAAVEQGTAADTNRISSAVKFVPYTLQVTRSLDLSGEGGSHESSAQLVGAIVVPVEFVPQKWGDAALTEVVDAKGNDLRLKEADEMRAGWSSRSFDMSDEAEAGDETPKVKTTEEHLITLTFRPPEWKVNEIARIKGTAELLYFSGSRLAKLTNAIPANWIVDQSKMRSGLGFSMGFDDSAKQLDSPALAALGLSLNLRMGMAQSGMTILMLEVGGKTALLDAQVFDAAGKPWPTFLQHSEEMSFGEESEGTTPCQIMVPGRPQAPLSLALRASGNAAGVTVPIALEHVPVVAKPK